MVYIRQKQLAGLHPYKYAGVDHSLVSKYVLKPFYTNVVIKCFPMSMAPNAITLSGFSFVIINFLTMLWYNPTMDQDMPPWVYWSFSIGLFLYQTFDAVDGTQASSATLTFYVQTWDEYYTQTLTLGIISGPVEGILTLCIVYAFTAVKGGGSFWQQSLLRTMGLPKYGFIPEYIYNLPFNEWYMVYGGLVLVFNTVQSALNVMQIRRKASKDPFTPLYGLLPYFLTWTFVPLYLYLQPIILHHHLIPFVFYIGLINAYAVGQIIIAHLTKNPEFPMYNVLTLPLGLAAMDSLGPMVGVWPSVLGDGMYQVAFVFLCMGLGVGIYGSFVYDIITTICDYLDIWCLTIKHPYNPEEEQKKANLTAKMLTRRLLSRPSPSSTVRALSTTSSSQRPPCLADIEPNGASAFDARQRKFRDGIKEAQKAKEKQDSQSAAALKFSVASKGEGGRDARTAGHASNAGSQPTSSAYSEMSNRSVTEALGSLSTHNTEAARQDSEQQDASKRKGALSSLIYGTREGQQMDQEIEKSFSQVLARGKYVHSIVFHTVKPDKVDEYVELVGGWYPKMAKLEDNHVNLVGSWRTEVGDCDTFVHIWEYQRYQGYHASLHSIASHPEFPAFDRKLKALITHKQTSLMQEFSFWPTTPPRQLGGLFELRSYTLHPGNLLEWETHWRKGLKARREVMEGVGAWFVQIGDLNTVHHLWQFANLEERKARREMSWGVEGWGDTVHKTVPLIQTMKSRVLVPMAWSPVA
ncbi:MAG: hypothetical protein Q9203_006018 [Teloschistes exilis]